MDPADNSRICARLYESQRRRGPVTLTAGFPLRAVTLEIKPYEIVTLRLVGA